jgi:hypothetical protein
MIWFTFWASYWNSLLPAQPAVPPRPTATIVSLNSYRKHRTAR